MQCVLYAVARPSVCLSTWVDHTKTVDSSFVMVNFTAKFKFGAPVPKGMGHQMRGVGKVRNFRPISRRHISETVQDLTKVTMRD